MSQKSEIVTNNAPHRLVPGLSGLVIDNAAVKDRSKKKSKIPLSTVRTYSLVTFSFTAGCFKGSSPPSGTPLRVLLSVCVPSLL